MTLSIEHVNGMCVDLSHESKIKRKKCVESLKSKILDNDQCCVATLDSAILTALFTSLTPLFLDKTESIREASLDICTRLVEQLPCSAQHAHGISDYLPLLLPQICRRLNPDTASRAGHPPPATNASADEEESEEIRLKFATLLERILHRLSSAGNTLSASNSLDAMFGGEIFAVIRRLAADKFAEIKRCANSLIELAAHTLRARFYHEAGEQLLTRHVLANTTHQHSRLRAHTITAALGPILNCAGPGSGGAAKHMQPIIQSLAQRCFDGQSAVRLAVVEVAGDFLLNATDRYSHFAKFIPLLLSGASDETAEIRGVTFALWHDIGIKYQKENEKDLKNQLDFPDDEQVEQIFQDWERPNLGCRQLVVTNLSKILPGLGRDMSDWSQETRRMATNLLPHLLFNAESHCTQHAEQLISSCLVAALANDEEDQLLPSLSSPNSSHSSLTSMCPSERAIKICAYFIPPSHWWTIFQRTLACHQQNTDKLQKYLLLLSMLIRYTPRGSSESPLLSQTIVTEIRDGVLIDPDVALSSASAAIKLTLLRLIEALLEHCCCLLPESTSNTRDDETTGAETTGNQRRMVELLAPSLLYAALSTQIWGGSAALAAASSSSSSSSSDATTANNHQQQQPQQPHSNSSDPAGLCDPPALLENRFTELIASKFCRIPCVVAHSLSSTQSPLESLQDLYAERLLSEFFSASNESASESGKITGIRGGGFWSSNSFECQMFIRLCLFLTPHQLRKLLPRLFPFLVHGCSKAGGDADFLCVTSGTSASSASTANHNRVRLQFYFLLTRLLQKCPDAFFAAHFEPEKKKEEKVPECQEDYFAQCISQLLIPGLAWSAGRTQQMLRKVSITCLWSLLVQEAKCAMQNGDVSEKEEKENDDDIGGDVHPAQKSLLGGLDSAVMTQLLTKLTVALDDELKETRLIASHCFMVILDTVRRDRLLSVPRSNGLKTVQEITPTAGTKSTTTEASQHVNSERTTAITTAVGEGGDGGREETTDFSAFYNLMTPLAKRLDDNSDVLRVQAAAMLSRWLDCFEQNERRCESGGGGGGVSFNASLYRAHLEQLASQLLIHLDDSEETVRSQVMQALQRVGRVSACVLRAELDKVREKHRSPVYCARLLEQLRQEQLEELEGQKGGEASETDKTEEATEKES